MAVVFGACLSRYFAFFVSVFLRIFFQMKVWQGKFLREYEKH